MFESYRNGLILITMSNNDFHKKPFDEETQFKLDIYRQYLRSWLPVFLNSKKAVHRIQIFDFFAGPGCDSVGMPGSPLIASEEIKNALENNAGGSGQDQEIHLYLNEPDSFRCHILQHETRPKILSQNPGLKVYLAAEEFQSLFFRHIPKLSLYNVANFVLLDQFGLKEITQEVFQKLISLSRTDMMFFVSSSIVNRMKKDKYLNKYLPPIEEMEWEQMNGSNVTRILRTAYSRWIPPASEYYLGCFSLKRQANVYGLIFGSSHPLGINKFLEAAWKKDSLNGEANFDIDSDGIDKGAPFLFKDMDKPTKVKLFEEQLEQMLAEKSFQTNLDLYLFGLRNGMLSSHVKDAIRNLQRAKKLPEQRLDISYTTWKKQVIQTIKYQEDKQI